MLPLPLLLPAETPADIDGLQVLFPPVYEIFWSALILLLLWLVLGRALPKIYGMLDQRREEIDEGLDAGQRAKDELALAKRQAEETLRQVAIEAKEIRDQAHNEAGRIVTEARNKALAQNALLVEVAEKQIAAEKLAAEVALRQDVGALATELAEKIVGEHLKDEALSARVIDRFMDALDKEVLPESTGVDV